MFGGGRSHAGGTEEAQELDLDVVPIDVAIEIKQVDFECALWLSARHGWAKAEMAKSEKSSRVRIMISPLFLNHLAKHLSALLLNEIHK